MKALKNIIMFFTLLISLLVGYKIGVINSMNEAKTLLYSNSISDLKNFNWSYISKEEARNTLGKHIDAAKVPYGDLVVPSNIVHSRRYIVSQWQRSAAGAIVIVLSRDIDGDLVLALGLQRGKLIPPQGYMELPLPSEDLTGLQAKGASRLNGSTGELINADTDLTDNAIREVKEELNLDITKDDLVLIGVALQNEEEIVPVIAAQYTIMLDKAPPLKVIDEEFIDDDLHSPRWFKVKDIKCTDSNCYVDGESIPIETRHVPMIQKALKHWEDQLETDLYKNFMNFKSDLLD